MTNSMQDATHPKSNLFIYSQCRNFCYFTLASFARVFFSWKFIILLFILWYNIWRYKQKGAFMKKNLLIIPGVINILTLILAIPAFVVGSNHILQYIWIFLALIMPIPDIIMSVKAIKSDSNKKIAITNIVFAAVFFIISVTALIIALVK